MTSPRAVILNALKAVAMSRLSTGLFAEAKNFPGTSIRADH